ncbi:TRAP transporter large permease [uncultured Psychromonas sp.]|uniref:TRAP transporter large permease n=1 Tax=uncultured Psychromonas sp. TaxID=173974 RepID=UPI002601D5E2|nr:TRAP transporter large permease [uncultured Psychromonas sp.]
MITLSITFVLFTTFFVLLIIGAPIAIALGGASVLSYLYVGDNPVKLVQLGFNAIGSFPLMAIPAFVFAGAVMEAAGISKRLVTIAESFAGSFTGGIGASTVVACLFFGAISGSGPATTAAVGMLMIPAMVKHNYSKDYAAALTSATGGLGIIIPPSIPMVIFGISALGITIPFEALNEYGSFQTISISKMFIAGIIPGLIISCSLLLYNYFYCKKNKVPRATDEWSFNLVFKACKDGIWSLSAPIIILGGIYTGLFTPTESAIVTIFYVVFVGIFIHKELTWKKIKKCIDSTAWLSGRIMLILLTATAFGRLLVENQIPVVIVDTLTALTSSQHITWLIIIGILMFVGMFMETLAAIMILTPVLLPVTYALGIDPVHFGVVMICCLSIGFSTPPLGENLFVASAIAETPFEKITAKVMPMVLISTLAVILIAFVPSLSLWLPSLMY